MSSISISSRVEFEFMFMESKFKKTWLNSYAWFEFFIESKNIFIFKLDKKFESTNQLPLFKMLQEMTFYLFSTYTVLDILC